MIKNAVFFEKFGRIFKYITGGLVYESNKNGDLYKFPDNVTEVMIVQLMTDSVKDNKNYVYSFLKDKKFTPKEHVLY